MRENRSVKLNNGVLIDRIGLGCWEVNGEETVQTILNAVDSGYRRIDTASYYKNEPNIGTAIRTCGVSRSELYIASKLWYEDMQEGRQEESFYQSLENLGLDYIDMYFLHWPIGEVSKSWRVLERLYEAGKIRAISVCNFQPIHLKKLLANANVCPAVNQFESNPRFQQNETIKFCLKEGIVPEAWGPLGKGKDLSLLLLEELAAKYEKTPAQIILRWHLQRDVLVIPKSVNKDRLRQNLNIFDYSLEEKDMDAINTLDTGTSSRSYPARYRFDITCEDSD